MCRFILCVPAIAFAFGVASAETASEVKLDTPQARAVVVTLDPHQRGQKEEHPMNRVLIYRDSGQLTLTGSDGGKEHVEFAAGDVRWNPAGSPYVAENETDHQVRIVEVELKGAPKGPLPVTKLDPVMVDAKHYKVVFENEQVRVLRIHYEPHEQGVLHEHILNRVVCYLNDQGRTRAGDIRMAGAATHTEQNAGDQPADRIAVELK